MDPQSAVNILKTKLNQGLSVDSSYNPLPHIQAAMGMNQQTISQPTPQPQQTISLAPNPPQPKIGVNNTPTPNVSLPAAYNPKLPTSLSTPITHPTLADQLGSLGKGLVQSAVNPADKFLNEIGALGQIVSGNQKGAQKTLTTGGLGHQGGVLGGKELAPGAVFIGPGAVKNIEKTAGIGAQLGSYGIGGVGALAKDTLGARIARSAIGGSVANTVGGAGQQLANNGKIQLKPTLEAAGAGALLGGGIPIAGALGKGAVRFDKAQNQLGAVGKNVSGMGGDSGKLFYHGTNNPDIKTLADLQAGSKVSGSSRNRVYVTENQDIAKNFGSNVVSGKLYGKHFNISDFVRNDGTKAPLPKDIQDYSTNKLLSPRDRRVFENNYLNGSANNTIIEDTPNIHNYLRSKGYTTITAHRASDVNGVRSETIIIDPKAHTAPQPIGVGKNISGGADYNLNTPRSIIGHIEKNIGKDTPTAFQTSKGENLVGQPRIYNGKFGIATPEGRFIAGDNIKALSNKPTPPIGVGKDVGGIPIKPEPGMTAKGFDSIPGLSAEAKADLSSKEQMKLADLEGMGPRGPVDITSPHQLTDAQPELNPAEGSHESAIAQASGRVAERNSLYEGAAQTAKGLSEGDKVKLSDAINGEDVGKVDNPEKFQQAVDKYRKANDYDLAVRRLAGAKTARFNNGNFGHTFYQAAPEAMDKLGIPENQRYELGDKVGFGDTSARVDGGFGDAHEIPRKYNSYAQAGQDTNGLIKPAFKNAIEDEQHYVDVSSKSLEGHLLKQALMKSNPEDVAELGFGRDANGKPFRQAPGGLPFNASESMGKALKNYGEAWSPDSRAGKVVEKGVKITGSATKKALFGLSFFHQAHISENFAFQGVLGREPAIFMRGIAKEMETKGGLSKTGYHNVLDHYRSDAHDGLPSTMEYARDMGLDIQGSSGLTRFVDSYVLSAAKSLKEAGIDAKSQEGIDVGKIYNRLAGRENAKVEGLNPTIQKFTSYFALAPHYLRSQLRLVFDAVAPKKIGGAGYDKLFKGTSAGGAARSAVVGPRLLGAITAITAGAIVMHKFPTWQQAANEAGLNPNNTNPNIPIKSKNSKGETQVMNLPTDPAGLAVGFLTDPKHFFQSRYSPALSFGTKIATNTNWNGQPLSDPNAPNSFVTRIKNAGINSVVPIGIQNFTNLQNSPNNPNVQQGVGQEFGLRLKTDPNDPQVQANKAHFALQTQLSNDLKKSGQFGQQDAQTFNNLHPTGTTDVNGFKYPTRYDPLSSSTKYDAYVNTDAQGHATLSPVFAADQKLNAQNPKYPSSPLYKLSGTGTDVDGKQAPQALVALEYQHAQDPAAKTVIMDSNGGQNGWLANYENKVADYSKNYQQNLTNYFQGLGWSAQAINDYWTKHPSTPDPIDNVNFDKPTTDLINQYYKLSAAGDSTATSQFFTKNADVLGPAFDTIAQHANALRSAKGELQMQGYPTESPNVKAIMSAWPTGSDAASKRARGISIKNNPDVNQYLADIALYEALSKGAQFRYQNPANMGATEGQNINAGGLSNLAGQSFLKNTANLGAYDIGKNPTTGQYDFLQGGALAPGSVAGGGLGGSSSRKPLVPMPKRLKSRRIKLHRAPRQRVHIAKFAKQQRPLAISPPSGLTPIKVAPPTQVLNIRA